MKPRRKIRFSIESRLLLWLTPPLVVICIATFFIAPKIITKITYKVFDRSLFSIALQLEDQLYFKQNSVALDLYYFNFIFPESKTSDSIYYKIVDPIGKNIIGFDDLPVPEMAGLPIKGHFFDDTYKGKKIRGVLYRTRLHSSTMKGFVEIIVAETTNERDLILVEILYTISALILFMFVLSITIAIVGIRQGIKPLKRIQKKIRKQSVDNLKMITLDVPLEVESLVISINSLIKRVQKGLSHIRYFNTDVSHQLRTPLSEMSALIEITAKEKDMDSVKKNMEQMKALNLYMSHTVQQLLMYAKVQKSSADLSNFKGMDIVAFIKEQCALAAPGIYRNHQSISFHGGDKPVIIEGDDILIKGMFLNIVDNAQKYAVQNLGTPQGEIKVTILKEKEKNLCCMEIIDQGPGIDEQFIEKAFDRHERNREDSPIQGFGFGLAIVKEVVLLHSGTVKLENRPPDGLCVIIKLPLADSDCLV